MGRKLLLEHLANSRRILAEISKGASLADNTTNIGNAREALITTFLAQNLPEAIKFSTGEVFDLKGDKSGQIDIILVSDAAPKIHLYGAVNLFPVETVLGVIEVKSNLTSGAKGELLKVLAHCKRLKKLYKMDRAHQEAAYLKSESYKFYSVPYIVFAYAGCSSDILITTLKGQISSACNHLKDMPDLIVVLDRGYTLSKNSGFLIEGATIDTVYTKNIEPEVVLLDLYKYLIILVDYWISNPQCFRIPLNYTESVNNMDDIFGVWTLTCIKCDKHPADYGAFFEFSDYWVSNVNIKGDFSALTKTLEKNGVSASDISSLKDAIAQDSSIVSDDSKTYGPAVKSWLKMMFSKAVETSWNIEIGVASSLLATALNSFYGWF